MSRSLELARHASLMAGLLALACLAAAQSPAPVVPQTPGFTSKPVLTAPVTGVDGKEVVLIAVHLQPGASSPPHTHPGDCYGMVIEGRIEMKAQGQAMRQLQTGDTYSNLGGIVHQFTNVGDQPVRMLNTLVVDKGRPRTVPAAAAPQ